VKILETFLVIVGILFYQWRQQDVEKLIFKLILIWYKLVPLYLIRLICKLLGNTYKVHCVINLRSRRRSAFSIKIQAWLPPGNCLHLVAIRYILRPSREASPWCIVRLLVLKATLMKRFYAVSTSIYLPTYLRSVLPLSSGSRVIWTTKLSQISTQPGTAFRAVEVALIGLLWRWRHYTPQAVGTYIPVYRVSGFNLTKLTDCGSDTVQSTNTRGPVSHRFLPVVTR
jgi:hypothetical protein